MSKNNMSRQQFRSYMDDLLRDQGFSEDKIAELNAKREKNKDDMGRRKPILAYPEVIDDKPKMPVYPTGVSAYPNHLARSALFSPIKRGARKLWENEKIASRDDVDIFFFGRQLDMGDCDVFLQAVKIAQGRPAGDKIVLNRAEFLKAIGRQTGKANYLWLSESFERITHSSIKIKSKRYTAILHLVDAYIKDEQTGEFYIRLNEEILKLYSNGQFGYIDIQKRLNIKKDFAKWLQSYVASHEKGIHKVSVEKLHYWSGSSMILKDWKFTKLKPALAELESLKIIAKVKVSEVVEWEKL